MIKFGRTSCEDIPPALLTDRATPRLDFVGDNVFTIHLYALASTNHRLEYIIIATKSFSSNKKHIRNSELKFRNSAFYSIRQLYM